METKVINRSATPWSILYSKKLTSTEKIVFMVIKDRIYNETKDKTCSKGWISHIDWIADNIGMSYDTVKKALQTLKKKEVINVVRVKVHQKVLNKYFINWDMIDKANSKHSFISQIKEEVDLLDDEQNDIMLDEQISEQTEVAEVKTPSIQVEETPIEEQIPTYTEFDNNENNEQTEEDMKLYEFPTGINSDEFYTAFVAGSIKYWIYLYNQDKKEELKNEIDKWAIYAANRFYDGEHAEECKDKIYEYITMNMAS